MRTTLRMAAAAALVIVPLTMLGTSAVFASTTPDPTCRPGHDYGCQRSTPTPTSSPVVDSSTSPPATTPPPPPLPETGRSAGTIAVTGAALVGTGAALGLGALAFTRRRRFQA